MLTVPGDDGVRILPARREILGVLALAIGIPLVSAIAVYALGSLSIPHADDWSYILTEKTFMHEGRVQLFGWVAVGLIGQLFLMVPTTVFFGTSALTLNLTVGALAAIGVFFVWALAREHLSHRLSLLVATTVAIFPAFGLLSTSFMTDIPALALTTIILWSGTRYLKNDSWYWLASALATGLLAFTIREQTLAATAALLLLIFVRAALRSGLRSALPYLFTGLLFIFLCVGFLDYRTHLPNTDVSFAPALDLHGLAHKTFRSVVTLSFALLPLSAIVWARLGRRSAACAVLLGAGLTATYFVYPHNDSLFVGNYLSSRSSYREASIGPAPELIPSVLWDALQVLSLLSAAILLTFLVSRMARALSAPEKISLESGLVVGRMLLALYLVFYSLTLLIPATAGWPIFDRYLMALLPGAMILGLQGIGKIQTRVRLPLGLACLVLVLTQFFLTISTAAFDAARWDTAKDLVAAGADPSAVAVGLEWAGTFADGPAQTALLRKPDPKDSVAWFSRMFPRNRECFVVTPLALDRQGLRLIRTHIYKPYLLGPAKELFVYQRQNCQ